MDDGEDGLENLFGELDGLEFGELQDVFGTEGAFADDAGRSFHSQQVSDFGSFRGPFLQKSGMVH